MKPGNLVAALAVLVALMLGAPVAATGWGNDRVPDLNDATCDDDEGTGNDDKCLGTDGSEDLGDDLTTIDDDDLMTIDPGDILDDVASLPSGNAWGHPDQTASHDSTCDEDQGFGNDERCEAPDDETDDLSSVDDDSVDETDDDEADDVDDQGRSSDRRQDGN